MLIFRLVVRGDPLFCLISSPKKIFVSKNFFCLQNFFVRQKNFVSEKFFAHKFESIDVIESEIEKIISCRRQEIIFSISDSITFIDSNL